MFCNGQRKVETKKQSSLVGLTANAHCSQKSVLKVPISVSIMVSHVQPPSAVIVIISPGPPLAP